MDADEILDGLALWDEHKPQSGQDWIAVAQRSVMAENYDPSRGSPLFRALYAAVEVLMEIAGADVDFVTSKPQRPSGEFCVSAAKRALASRDSQETTP
jgi:hypothetical protein